MKIEGRGFQFHPFDTVSESRTVRTGFHPIPRLHSLRSLRSPAASRFADACVPVQPNLFQHPERLVREIVTVGDLFRVEDVAQFVAGETVETGVGGIQFGADLGAANVSSSVFSKWYNPFTNRKKVKMATVDFKLSLPDQLRKEAEAAGLLSPKAIERLLREEIRRRRVDNFFAAADRLAALGLPLLSDEEIAQEIRLARRPTAA